MAAAVGAAPLSARGASWERTGLAAGRRLAVEGFCVVEGLAEAGALQAALDDVAELRAEGRLQQPPAMIVDGLLGPHGSARICDLWGDGEEEASEWVGGEAISALDAEMTEFGEVLAPILAAEAGLEVESRTGGVVHEAGMPEDEDPSLSGGACAKWLNIFANHRLMLVWNLGPGRGTLELQPFDEECSGAEVPLPPGSLAVLRPDAMLHRFVSASKANCLTCFLLGRSSHGRRRGATGRAGDDGVTPCCQALETWAYERMREYKESLPHEQARLGLPRRWELLASHTNFVGQHVAVRSAAVKQPSTWDPAAWGSAFVSGPDYATEVPLVRWDHGAIFEPDDGRGWAQWKTSCQHGAFIDGIELFDNALFRLSPVESRGMDPGHRLTLETGYEALQRDGYKASKLMNSRGGVYVANPPSHEWGDAEKIATGAGGVCGGGGSIACGRFSFVFGMKGPCISVDVEGASSLVAVSLAGTNLSRVGNWEPIPFAVCSSYSLQMNPRPYIYGSCRGIFSPVGRTCAMDTTASGYVRGDVAISVVLKALAQTVDGVPVVQENYFLGALAGCATNQSGRRAHVTAADAVALQEVVAESLRQADISPLDVDACEAYADGMMMSDAIEASAATRACRPDDLCRAESASPLALMASKAPLGNQLEACGLSSILKVVLGAQCGLMAPSVHLRILNPYIDYDLCERPAFSATELLAFGMESSYTGVANRSCVGTNCHAIVWGHTAPLAEEAEAAPAIADVAWGPWPRGGILFWPEGGGELPPEQVPRRGYSIAGTWNGWQPAEMSREGPGAWSAVLTLGVNRWERFQLLLDGDRDRVLHPSPGGGASVAGPAPALRSESWLVDGRLEVGSGRPIEAPEEGAAVAGDRYRVRLRVRGKWRAVDWERLPRAAAGAAEVGEYHVVGSWGHYEPQAMAGPDEGGAHALEVHIPTAGEHYFQVLRNRDWCQVVCPAEPVSDDASGVAPALVPEENWGHTWRLFARCGDVFRVELRRGGDDPDRVTVSWQRLRSEPLGEQMALLVSLPQFHIAGSWDAFGHPARMQWTGECCHAFVELGSRWQERFQIFRNADPRECIYPSEPEAAPGEDHELRGPDAAGHGRCWVLRRPPGAAAPVRYKVRLFIDARDVRPVRLDCVGPLPGVEGLEEAKGRGYLLVCP